MLQQIVNLYIAIYDNKGHSKKAIRQNWKLVTFQNCLATPEINVREYEEKQSKNTTQYVMDTTICKQTQTTLIKAIVKQSIWNKTLIKSQPNHVTPYVCRIT
jgi:hypothetical protein